MEGSGAVREKENHYTKETKTPMKRRTGSKLQPAAIPPILSTPTIYPLARPNLQKRRAENFEKFKIDFEDSDIRRISVSLEHPCNGEPRPHVSVHQEYALPLALLHRLFFDLEGVEIGLRHSKCRLRVLKWKNEPNLICFNGQNVH